MGTHIIIWPFNRGWLNALVLPLVEECGSRLTCDSALAFGTKDQLMKKTWKKKKYCYNAGPFGDLHAYCQFSQQACTNFMQTYLHLLISTCFFILTINLHWLIQIFLQKVTDGLRCPTTGILIWFFWFWTEFKTPLIGKINIASDS